MPKTVPEMVGEVLREIGALAIVLVPLDMIFTRGPIHWRIVAYALGIVLERIRGSRNFFSGWSSQDLVLDSSCGDWCQP